MDKIRVAILGCGSMAGAHVGRLRHRGDVQIVALCDVSNDIVGRFVEKHLKDDAPPPQRFTDPAQMYRDAKPDAVVIVTPHTLHFEHGMQALDAGCHVLMEKPMVTSAADARKLAEKVKQTGKVFVIGYNTPCTPEFQFLRETIRTKSLGRLELVSGYLSQNWMTFTKNSWRQDPRLSGGGQAYDSGAHLLNSLCWSVESDLAEVFAMLDNHGTPVDINASITVRFASGVIAGLVIGGNCPPDGSSMHFLFDGGRIDIDGWNGHWINVYRGWERVKYPHIPGQWQSPSDNFIDAILGRAQPLTSAQNGIIQCELMDAIYDSARTGMPVRPRR